MENMIIMMLSPVRQPTLTIFKDGTKEQIGGITQDNVIDITYTFLQSTDIKKVYIYGKQDFTLHFGKVLQNIINANKYMKSSNIVIEYK